MKNNITVRSLHRYVAIFSIAFSTLALELLQTKILSAVFFNHVVYLTVTIAMMGFGIAGVFLALYSHRLPLKSAIAGSMFAFSVSSVACIALASRAPLLFPPDMFFLKLLFCYATLIIPFFFSGVAIGLLLMEVPNEINPMYFADLIGSSLGIVVFVFFLRPMGADRLLYFLGGISVWAALMYVSKDTVPRIRFVLVLALVGFISLVSLGTPAINSWPESYKTTRRLRDRVGNTTEHEKSIWTTIAKIDVFADSTVDLVTGRPNPAASKYKLLTQDGDAFTVLPSAMWRDELSNVAKNGQPYWSNDLVYRLNPNPNDVLVIGAGGGMDVISARTYGAKNITALEINKATVDLVQNDYRSFLEWPSWQGVRLLCEEGRHFVRKTSLRFDVIAMTGIDTFSALSSGAYVLAENYLYTVEALSDYLTALKPNGTVVIFRWLFARPRETLRLANLFIEASDRLGVKNPSKNVIIVSADFQWSYYWASTFMKTRPYTADEVLDIVRVVESRPDLATIYVPDVFPKSIQETVEAKAFAHRADTFRETRAAFYRLLRSPSASDRRDFETLYEYDIRPVYDNRPFFFEYFKTEWTREAFRNWWGLRGTFVHYVLYILFVITTLGVGICMLLPLWVFERQGINVPGAGCLAGFFSSLGVGFMFLEIGFMQKLAVYWGQPMYSLVIVLAGLLMFTGVGSFAAGQKDEHESIVMKKALMGLLFYIPIWMVFTRVLVTTTLGSPLWVKALLTLLVLSPIGYFAGQQFGTCLKYIGKHEPRFIPWAWGINGACSVMASILAIILAMRVGFTMVIVLGGLVYVAAFFFLSGYFRKKVSA